MNNKVHDILRPRVDLFWQAASRMVRKKDHASGFTYRVYKT